MTTLNELKKLAKFASRQSPAASLPPGIEDWKIDSFENRTQLAVPSKLRSWLRFTNGPEIGIQGIYGIQTRDSFYDIEKFISLYPKWIQLGWIPIGGDGCGNYYVITTNTPQIKDPPVCFVDCLRNPDAIQYIVASDLFHFIESYIKKDLGEQGWPCDKDKVSQDDPDIMSYYNFNKCWDY